MRAHDHERDRLERARLARLNGVDWTDVLPAAERERRRAQATAREVAEAAQIAGQELARRSAEAVEALRDELAWHQERAEQPVNWRELANGNGGYQPRARGLWDDDLRAAPAG